MSTLFAAPPAFDHTPECAALLDLADPLSSFRERFHFPRHQGSDAIYFCGNSLGLQPINVKAAIDTELDTWATLGVGGYFGGTHPWLRYQDYCTPALGRMMGADPGEITVMNALTVNLHLMMVSFYSPTPGRFKIMMEAGAFPSDQYAVETQLRHYGIEPETAIIELSPRLGEKLLRTQDILDAIALHGESLALTIFGGINYYTGQLYDIAAITAAAHAAGAFAGFDLAHVAGNVPMQLHQWDVDFAVWCSYKYLNAGPGAVGGVFVHQKHAENTSLNRLGGWWGNDEKLRFKMEKGFLPKADASGWALSTSQVFNTVCLKAALEIMDEAGIGRLRQKSMQLTAYLEYLLQQLNDVSFEIITPANPGERGAQLSLFFRENGRAIHQQLIDNGVIVDYREPGVIRVAPAPLYCSFTDVYRFYDIINKMKIQ